MTIRELIEKLSIIHDEIDNDDVDVVIFQRDTENTYEVKDIVLAELGSGERIVSIDHDTDKLYRQKD